MNESETERFSIPYAADLSRINEIVSILYTKKAYEKPTKRTDISNSTGIHANTISSNMKFLRTFGIVTSDSNIEIKLTDEGKDYGESINLSDDVKEKNTLKKLCEKKLADLKQFCEMRMKANTLTYDDLFKQIARISNTTNIESNAKKGIEAVIQILIKAGIVDSKFLPENNLVELPKQTKNKKQANKQQNNNRVRNLNNQNNNLQNTNNLPQSQFQNISQERLGIDIKIDIDAKDTNSFENTLRFLRNVTSISKNKNFDVNISKELETKNDED